MAGDPKYGGVTADFRDVLARMRAEAASLEVAQKKLAATEIEATQALKVNTTGRLDNAGAMRAQAEAAQALATSISAETALLRANAQAWAANAAAARGATAETGLPTRYGRSTVSLASVAPAASAAEQAAASEAQGSRLLAQNLAAQQALNRLGGGLGPSYVNLVARNRVFNGPLDESLRSPAPSKLSGAGPNEAATDRATQSMRRLTAAEAEMAARAIEDRQVLGSVDAELNAVNATLVRTDALYAAASTSLSTHGALSTESIQALARGEVTLREFGSQMTTTIGKFAGWAIAAGAVYTAYGALKKLGEGALQTQSGVAQLTRSLPDANKVEAGAGFRKVSSELNVSIREVADAQYYSARAFHNQAESLEVARTALLAYKLDQVNPQDAVKTFSALNVAFKLNAKDISKVFDELDVGQLKFNARLNQTLPAVGRAAASVANAGGNPKELNEQIIQLYRTTGGGGGTGGGNPSTFLIREPANLRRPAAETVLKDYGFDPKDAQKNYLRFNREVQQRAGQLSDTDLARLAQAAGGGSALGLRYALPLFRAGRTPLPEEVNAELGHSAGAVEHDLSAKLSEVHEVASKFGTTLEQIGSEIAETGLITALDDIFKVINAGARSVEGAIAPLTTVGHLLGSLPQGVQDLALFLVGATALTKFSRSQAGLLGREFAGKVPVVGKLAADTADERDAQYTAARVSEDRTKKRQRVSTAAKAKAEQASELAERDRLFEEENAQALAAQETNPTKEGEALRVQRANNRAETATVLASANAGKKRAEQLERDEALAKENEANLLGKPGSEGAGKSHAERLRLYGGGEAAPASLTATSSGIKAVESQAAQEGAATGAKLAAASTTGWKAGLADSAAAAAYAVSGGKDSIASATKDASRSLTGKLGNLFTGFGGKLTQVVSRAFIGAAAAQIAGEIAGGSVGSTIAKAGTDAAYGAALGGVFGPEGAVAGALAGGALGLLQTVGSKKLNLVEKAKYGQEELVQKIPVIGAVTDFIDELAGEGHKDPKREREERERQITANEVLDRERKAEKRASKLGAKRTPNRRPGAGVSEEDRIETPEELQLYGREVSEAVEKNEEKKIGKFLADADAESKLFANTTVGANATHRLGAIDAALRKQIAVNPELSQALTPQIQTGVQDQLAVIQEQADRATKLHGAAAGLKVAEQQGQFSLNAEFRQPLKEAAYYKKQEELKRERLEGEEELPSVRKDPSKAKKIAEELNNVRISLRHRADEIKELNDGTGHVKEGVEAVEQAHRAAKLEEGLKLSASQAGLAEAEAGRDPAAKLKIAEKHLDVEEANIKASGNALTPDVKRERLEAVKKQRSENHEKLETNRLELLKAEGAKAEAEVPLTDTARRAEVHVQQLVKQNALIQRSKASPVEKLGAETAVLEARQAASETLRNQQTQLVQVQGQIAQALDTGNSVQEAHDAQAVAAKLLALAKTPVETAQAQLLAIQASNQLREALAGRIKLDAELADSKTLDPLKRDRIDIAAQRKVLAHAKGPEAKEKAQTELNNLKTKQSEDIVAEANEVIDFQLHTGQIGQATAVAKWQEILRHGHISKQRERDLRTKIFDAQNQQYELDVGNIRQPTLYDVRTARRPIRGIAGGSQVDLSTLHQPAQVNQTNHVAVYVRSSHPQEVVRHIKRTFDTHTKAALRTAGIS